MLVIISHQNHLKAIGSQVLAVCKCVKHVKKISTIILHVSHQVYCACWYCHNEHRHWQYQKLLLAPLEKSQ